ncbi:uncharacterized protein LOC115072754 [Nannospalax galili]|uniref:uncharacterized protein LOC115072754 n=1 Tax=Nannospalax galili TaxID=1026970 RepID=UPI00111C8908|nr:uncharacterized protein LOC115072754 [Nannospalax galili]
MTLDPDLRRLMEWIKEWFKQKEKCRGTNHGDEATTTGKKKLGLGRPLGGAGRRVRPGFGGAGPGWARRPARGGRRDVGSQVSLPRRGSGLTAVGAASGPGRASRPGLRSALTAGPGALRFPAPADGWAGSGGAERAARSQLRPRCRPPGRWEPACPGNRPPDTMPPRRQEKCKLPVPLPEGKVLDDMEGKQWVLGKMIGSGGFGLIYLGIILSRYTALADMLSASVA